MTTSADGLDLDVMPMPRRPAKPGPHIAFPEPKPYPLTPLRRVLKRVILRAVDGGRFGLHPLERHVVVCGFPRSGSTLLLLMLETCVTHCRGFGGETRALTAARFALRNHRLMVTKRPDDLYWVDELREYYVRRHATVRFVLTVRDPRAVLTSFHDRHGENQYYVDPVRWRAMYEHYRYAMRFDDVCTIEYADLIERPDAVEERVKTFVGCEVHAPFAAFHTAASDSFDTAGMHGVRPLDPTRIRGWRHERHRQRMRDLLCQMPELPECLIHMGYEPDTAWVRDYV